jgi:hypothetical protein
VSCVQALPSALHEVPSALATGAGHVPVSVLHAPMVWHWSVVHVTDVPVEVHVPPWHVSMVQALPSRLHDVPLALATGAGHPLIGLHAPIVWH